MTFKLNKDHIKLLQEAEWRWERGEFGAPAIDCKRPFGSSSGIYNDMAEILGIEMVTDKWGDTHLSAEDQAYVEKTWSELLEAIEEIMDNADLLLELTKEIKPKCSDSLNCTYNNWSFMCNQEERNKYSNCPGRERNKDD